MEIYNDDKYQFIQFAHISIEDVSHLLNALRTMSMSNDLQKQPPIGHNQVFLFAT